MVVMDMDMETEEEGEEGAGAEEEEGEEGGGEEEEEEEGEGGEGEGRDIKRRELILYMLLDLYCTQASHSSGPGKGWLGSRTCA